MSLRRLLPLLLCAALALAPAAFAEPDAGTGGFDAPDEPASAAGGAFGPEPEAPAPAPAAATGASEGAQAPARPGAAGPAASAAQAGSSQTPAQNGEGDVEVEVPVPPAQRPPTTPSPAPEGGLARTGFAAGLFGLFGLGFGAIGLTLLRLSAPARLRRRAQRRHARARAAGHRAPPRHASSARARAPR